MRWQRGLGWLMLAAVPAILSMWGTLGCSGPVDKSDIKFTVGSQFLKVKGEIPITIEVLDKEGKPAADGSSLSLITTLGSFKEKSSNLTANLKVEGGEGKVKFTFYAGEVAGAATITAKSEFKEKQLTLIILGEEKPPELVPEVVAEPEKTDAGPKEVTEKEAGRFIPLTIKLQARKTKIRANGKEVTEVTAKVTEPKLPLAELEKLKLVFRTSLGKLLDPASKAPLKPMANTTDQYSVSFRQGVYKVLLLSGIRAGTAIVEASVSGTDRVYAGEGKVQVDIVELGFLSFQPIKPNTIGTQGSGNEVTTVSVKVLDTNNEVFPEGTRVYFKLTKPIGGSSVTTSEALTNSKGIAFTQVKSGRDVGSVTVKALVAIEVDTKLSGCPLKCVDDTDCNSCGYSCHLGACKKTIEALSSSIAIVGGRPSYRGLTFSCVDRNVGALASRIGSNIVNTINTKCTVKLADRFTNKVGFSTQVIFMSEAGAIDPSASTKAGTAGGGGTEGDGTVTVSVRTQNPPPVDVPPLSVRNENNCKDPKCTQPRNGGYWRAYNCTKSTALNNAKTLYVEPWYTDDFGRVRNPRDGLVTIVAYTNGEEQFTDTNKNGRYDVGEPFIDLGEPYIDVNDNNKWDARLPGLPNGEPFVDIPCSAQQAKNGINGCKQANVGNGRRDGPNGLWDEDTLIWKKTWILWTGCLQRRIEPSRLNPAVNLRSCTKIPFQSGLYMLDPKKGGLNSDPKDSFGLNNFKPFPYNSSKAFFIKPANDVLLKALWHDENLNPLTKASAASASAKDVALRMSPTNGSFGLSNITGFGFEPHSLLLPASGSAFTDELLLVPTSFFGVDGRRLFSHTFFLSDSDQKLSAQAIPASFAVEITVNAGKVTCKHARSGTGETQ